MNKILNSRLKELTLEQDQLLLQISPKTPLRLYEIAEEKRLLSAIKIACGEDIDLIYGYLEGYAHKNKDDELAMTIFGRIFIANSSSLFLWAYPSK